MLSLFREGSPGVQNVPLVVKLPQHGMDTQKNSKRRQVICEGCFFFFIPKGSEATLKRTHRLSPLRLQLNVFWESRSPLMISNTDRSSLPASTICPCLHIICRSSSLSHPPLIILSLGLNKAFCPLPPCQLDIKSGKY